MKIQYIWIMVFIFIFILFLVLIWTLNSQTIKFSEISTLKGNNESLEEIVYILKSSEDSLAFSEDDLSKLDFINHNFIVTRGWKLKEISYSKFNAFSKVKEKLVKITLYEEDGSNRFYIYKIGKIDIFLDEHFSNGGIVLE